MLYSSIFHVNKTPRPSCPPLPIPLRYDWILFSWNIFLTKSLIDRIISWAVEEGIRSLLHTVNATGPDFCIPFANKYRYYMYSCKYIKIKMFCSVFGIHIRLDTHWF